MGLINSLVALLVALYLCLRISSGKIIEGELVTDKNWAFLTRFCFLSKTGRFEYKISYPKEFAPQNILLYYDTKKQWPSVYKKNLTCEEKVDVLSWSRGQIINLTQDFKFSGCMEIGDNETNSTVIDCDHYRMFESARERWWFIAVNNCGSRQGLRLKYKVTMTNDGDNGWLKHFSADQFYILHTDVVFTALYYLLFVASCFEARALHQRHLLHVTYKMYLSSLLAQSLGLTLLTAYYASFAQNGLTHEPLKLAGKSLEALSTLIFLLLLILLAKGYTVTRARLKKTTSTKIGIFMSIYVVCYAGLFFYEQMVFDPGEVLYIYESLAGYGLIFLRLLGWAWFVYAIVFTLIHYPNKSVFFTRLFLSYSVWFISAPVVVLISTLAVPKWMREKIINGVELLIAIEAHFVFFLLTRPSAANKNFPFHVRTTQINVMGKTGEAGDNTLDHFAHYSYAPTRPSAPLPIPAIFTISAANGYLQQQPHQAPGFVANGSVSTSYGTIGTEMRSNGSAYNAPHAAHPVLPAVDSDTPL